jgi:fluoride exporter
MKAAPSGRLYDISDSARRIPLGLWVALGGGAGATARFQLSGWATTWTHATFPWGTLAVNVAGSAILGFLLRTLPPEPRSVRLRALLTIGFCGGFTTFSTFDLEMFTLLAEGRHAVAAGYATLSVGSCVAGVLGGLLAGAAVVRSRAAS